MDIRDWISATTLAFAGVAAFGSLITGLMTSRQARTAWARDETLRVAREFLEALETSTETVAGSPVSQALMEHGYGDLVGARSAAQASVGAVSHALNRMTLFATEETLARGRWISLEWGELIARCAPMAGVTHRAALMHRNEVLTLIATARTLMVLQIRGQDLRTGRPWKRRRHQRLMDAAWDQLEVAIETMQAKPLSDPDETLVAWRVRPWIFDTILEPGSAGYLTDSVPWTAVGVDHVDLQQPLAAVAIKPASAGWALAIDSSVDAEKILALKRDVVKKVMTHGWHSGSTELGVHGWIDGPNLGDQIHFWPIASDDAIEPPEGA